MSKEVPESYRTIARQGSRKVTPGDPGEPRSCSKVAEDLSTRGRTTAPDPRIGTCSTDVGQFGPMLPIWAKLRPNLVDQNRPKFGRGLAKFESAIKAKHGQ